MMENRMLIGRESLAKRWDMKVSTVIKYENEGIITRVPGIPSPKYNIEEIMKVEGSEINPLSPLERRRLEKEVNYWKERYTRVKDIINKILPELLSTTNL